MFDDEIWRPALLLTIGLWLNNIKKLVQDGFNSHFLWQDKNQSMYKHVCDVLQPLSFHPCGTGLFQ